MKCIPILSGHDIALSEYMSCQLQARISSNEKVSPIPCLSYAGLSQTTRSSSGFTSPLLQDIGLR